MLYLIMKNKSPRYKNNLYITYEKHISRTIKTYLKYEDIKKMYLTFNNAEDKYQLHLLIELKDTIPEDAIEVFDREIAMFRKTDTNLILEIIQNSLYTLYKKDFIDRLIQLVRKFHGEKLNSFFLEDEENVVSKLKEILPSSNNQNMIARRIYTTLLNKLVYIEDSFEKIDYLKDEVYISESRKKRQVNKDIKLLNFKLEKINNLYKEYDTYETENIEEINEQIKHYYNPSYENTKNIDDLILEKNLIEHNQLVLKQEISLLNKIKYQIKEAISYEFNDYIKIKAYLDSNNKNFTQNAITRYSKKLIEDVNISKKLSGAKSRKSIEKLKKMYSSNYSDFYKTFIDINKKHLFIYKLKALHKNKHLLSHLNKTEQKELIAKNEISKEIQQNVKLTPTLSIEEEIIYLKNKIRPIQDELNCINEYIIEIELLIQECYEHNDKIQEEKLERELSNLNTQKEELTIKIEKYDNKIKELGRIRKHSINDIVYC
ncbi:hypothetical protein ACH5BF_03140 [Arcobacter sp. YIC-464]|uniref:hypothetical protein n=1 Tax=Arcobacter sp. YIC-464 TaxID=3376631 RepID=UPI003C27B52C